MKQQMLEFRCTNCGHLLAKERVERGEFEIKCSKCKTYNRVSFSDFGKEVDTFRPSVYDVRDQEGFFSKKNFSEKIKKAR